MEPLILGGLDDEVPTHVVARLVSSVHARFAGHKATY